MLKKLIFITAIGLAVFAYQANAAEVIPYGTFNYKLSNDEIHLVSLIVNLKIMVHQSV